MAYFMFRTQIIGKAKQSVVASAAYRSGDKLYSERDGLMKNYGRREVPPETYILTPEHAPEWTKNRETLWNEVEKKEKQWNSQLAREVLIALPTQLTHDEQTSLVLHYCRDNFVKEGMVADISIHRDKEHNPHAHVLLTLRPFEKDGSWGNKRKKINGKSVHLTNWNKKSTLLKWRKNLADRINEKFIEKGLDDRVSHESYEKQGIDQIPKIRLSREAYQYENKVKQKSNERNEPYQPSTYYGKLNQEIHEINQELKALKNDNVVSLDEKRDNNIEQSLKKIKQSILLNDVQKSALVMVAKRAKSYVDYRVAKNIYLDLNEGTWKKSLDSRKVKLQGEKNILNKALKTIKTNPEQVKLYGFNLSRFKEDAKDKLNKIKEGEKKLSDDQLKYVRILKKAELALEIQTNVTNQEFQVIYPTVDDSLFNTDEKFYAVQHFKDTGNVLDQEAIREYSTEKQRELQKDRVPTIHEQTRNLSKSVFILNRAIQKQTRLRKEAVEKGDLKQAYNASSKIEQYQIQVSHLEKDIKAYKGVILNDLMEHYQSDLPERIQSTDALLSLHQMYQDQRSTGDIGEDLKMAQKDVQEASDKGRQDDRPERKVESHFLQSVAKGLWDALDELYKEDGLHKDNVTNRNRRRKRGRRIGRNNSKTR